MSQVGKAGHASLVTPHTMYPARPRSMTDRRVLQLAFDECKRSVDNLHEEIFKMRRNMEQQMFVQKQSGRRVRTHFSVRRKLMGHYGKVYALYWSHTSESQLVSASQDGKIVVWDANRENKKIAIPLRSAWVMTCAFSPDSTYIACGGLDNLVTVYALPENSQGWEKLDPYRELSQHEGYISCCRFLDTTHVLSSSGDQTCLLWDITRGRPIANFLDHCGDVMAISICRQRDVFISVSCDKTAKLWDIRAGEKCVGNFEGHNKDINTCDWFPDGYAFGTGSDDATVKLFDTRAYRQLNSYQSNDVTAGVTSMKFSHSGKYIFVGYDDPPYMLCWDALQTLKTQDFGLGNDRLAHRISCLDVNCSGKAIATGSWDNNLRVWS